MAGGGQGSEPAEGPAVSGLLAWCLSCRDGGDLLHDGTGAARGSQAYLGPRALCAPGDMMIDWVSSRLRGDAAAQSIQAVRLALRGRTGSG